MKRKLPGNIGLKLVSVMLAFLIWLLVVNVDNPVKSRLFKDVKIQVINEDSVTAIDKSFDIVSEDTVVIKVTERRRVLESLSSSDFTVVADMENLNEMNSVPLTVTCRNSSVTLDEMTIVPSSMKVQLEQIKQGDFVINVTTSGTPQNGYEVGETEVLEGKTVQIAGPESLIDRIGQVTANVRVSGISSDQRLTTTLTISDKNGDALGETKMSQLQITDSNGVLLSDNQVTVDVTLWKVMSDIPVEVNISGSPADGYNVMDVSTVPVTVSLVGTAEALAELNGKIVLDDTVSVEGVTETFTEELDLSATLNNIEDLRLIKDADPTITVTVQIEKSGDQTLQVPLSNLEVLNRPTNDIVLTFSPADVVSVTVHDEDGAGALQISDIKGSIDLAQCSEAGDYEIPVEIELPDGYTLVSPVILKVNAAEQEIEGTTEEPQ